jgi:hypothetical protein
MSALAEEWRDVATEREPGRRGRARWLAVAAAIVVLAVAVGWGTASQVRVGRLSRDASAYQNFLATLGGKDVRAGRLVPVGGSSVEGSAVLYDGEWERSWALVLFRAPGYSGSLTATLSSPSGRPIQLFPAEIEADGEGSTWLVTSGDLVGYHTVTVTDESGTVVARARLSDSD